MAALIATIISLPLTILIHELGHAVIAMYLSRRPVEVQVGTGGPAVRLNVRGLRLTLSARQSLLGVGGWASFDRSELTAVSLLLIALAGPAASAAVAVATGMLLGRHPDAFLPDLVSAVTAGGWACCLVNLVPFKVPMRGGRRVCTDGLVALGALAHIATHRTARLAPAPYDPASDERALATLRRLADQRVADSSALDMTGALREILHHRPELDAAVRRRRAAALSLAIDAPPEQRRAMVDAAMDPAWRGA